MALNYYTQLTARSAPRLRVSGCSPGFCRTDIAGVDADYSKREPKDPQLGASVVVKLLFDELGVKGALGEAESGCFWKECSKPGTPLEEARSAPEPWAS